LRHIRIDLNIKKELPLVVGDSEKIKLVIENLLDNAIKYTTSGGKIEVKISKSSQYLITEVKDNGVGIPEEQLGRVFEKFFRSDNVVRYQTEGTGLGLYIAKNIVEQLGGEIWFKSIENVGSVFSFSLPTSK
jgi:signal transduction histidine kinase